MVTGEKIIIIQMTFNKLYLKIRKRKFESCQTVEALVFIVIGRICSKGCGIDSHCRPGSFLRFNSRPIMYVAFGSLVLSWSPTRQPGFVSFWCL